jgi:YHS domain-containing protein
MLKRMISLFTVPLVALLLAGAAPATALAAKSSVYTGFLSSLAVNGYDPVAYFTEKRPVKGSAKYELKHKGATWRFASQKNLDAFKADPDKYAPRYGGYCAWAVSQGYTAKGDPNYWKIVDGKLYLNYDASVQSRWEKDIPGFISKADKNWPAVIK